MTDPRLRPALIMGSDALATPLAAIAAPLAGTIWWLLVDDVSVAQALRTPFPYVLLGISWFLATPTFLVTFSWSRGRLSRLLILATLGCSPFVVSAQSYFMVPRAQFASFLILSTAWVSTIAFWAVFRAAQRPRTRQCDEAE